MLRYTTTALIALACMAAPAEARKPIGQVRCTAGGCALVMYGTASWYHEGRLTANGERFRPDGLTAAHRTLPFGTMVEVTNTRNGRSVVVRVNDRGPAKWTGREIDMSRGAAGVLDMRRAGLAPVKIERVK